jgi:aspartate/tyrosine/aromatic aminotransferase
VSTIDPNIAERIIRPAQQGQQQIVQDEQQDLAQIFAGIPKNIKPGTPPQLGLQVIQQYLQQPDVQQRFQQDQPFRERLEARAKQYQFQLQQQQNAVIGRLGAQMPGPMPATTST